MYYFITRVVFETNKSYNFIIMLVVSKCVYYFIYISIYLYIYISIYLLDTTLQIVGVITWHK